MISFTLVQRYYVGMPHSLPVKDHLQPHSLPVKDHLQQFYVCVDKSDNWKNLSILSKILLRVVVGGPVQGNICLPDPSTPKKPSRNASCVPTCIFVFIHANPLGNVLKESQKYIYFAYSVDFNH